MTETTRTEGRRMHRQGRAAFFAAFALVAASMLGGCGSSPAAGDGGQPQAAEQQRQAPEPSTPPPEEPEVTVGYDDEDWLSRLGGELYARALEENGFDATLEEGQIGRDVVMGYSGSATGSADEESDGVMLTPAAGVEDRYVMSTSPEKAEAEGLSDVADLLEIDDVDIAASEYIPEPLEEGPLVEFYSSHPQTNQNAFDYLPGNLSSGDNPLPSYRFLEGGAGPDADAVLGWSVDGEIAAQGLVVLEDSQGLLPEENYHPAPVVRAEVLEEHPELEGALDRLSAALTTEDVRALAAAVDVEDEDPKEAVAAYWGENLAREVSG